MTEAALEEAKRIQAELERITEAKEAIMAYQSTRVELEVTAVKGLMHFNADEETKKKFVLWSDSPLFVAIAAALEGMREELQEQIANLDSNKPETPVMERDYGYFHPIAKTSWWKKAFRWRKK
jgi:hypothetical protein